MAYIYNKFEKKEPQKRKFYALTLQNNYFETLKSNNILAISEITEYSDTFDIDYIQVNPEQTFNAKLRTYYKIGTAIVEELKKTLCKKDIRLYAIDSGVENFYKKLGFTKVGNSMIMVLKNKL